MSHANVPRTTTSGRHANDLRNLVDQMKNIKARITDHATRMSQMNLDTGGITNVTTNYDFANDTEAQWIFDMIQSLDVEMADAAVNSAFYNQTIQRLG